MNYNPSEFHDYLNGIEWVWIDLDDTLIDFNANSLVALKATYLECDLHRYFPSCEAWIESYRRHNHALWERYNRAEISQDYLRTHRFLDPINERTYISEADFAETARSMDRLYLDRLAQCRTLVPGAMELIDALRERQYNIGVLSNGFADVQHRKIRATGLADKIDLTVLSDDIGVNKPDPRIYRYAMERAGSTDPARHLMIGDNPATDISGALASGWRTAQYSPSSPALILTANGIVTPTLPELASLFRTLSVSK